MPQMLKEVEKTLTDCSGHDGVMMNISGPFCKIRPTNVIKSIFSGSMLTVLSPNSHLPVTFEDGDGGAIFGSAETQQINFYFHQLKQ